MLFTELLKTNNLTADNVSHGLKVKINRYNKLFDAIEEEKKKLPLAKTPKARVTIEGDIKRGEENLAAMNEEICAGVQKFSDNRELNERKAANLAAARAKKAQPAKVVPITEDANPKEGNGEEATTPVEEVVEPVKKKGSFAAILGGIIITGLLGAVGYNIYKNRQ